jgi:transposase
MGRPTAKTPSIEARLLFCFYGGLTIGEAAQDTGVSRASVHRWLNRYPNFRKAAYEAMGREDKDPLIELLREALRPKVVDCE